MIRKYKGKEEIDSVIVRKILHKRGNTGLDI
jgi:hypothetical protein